MAAIPAQPAVVVPMNDAMASEPARTIGQMFADKVMVKTLVAAIIGIVALAFKVTVDDAMVDNITTVITLGSIVLSGVFAQYDAKKRAVAQAEQTRDAVYSPNTVATIVAAEQPKEVDAVVIPAPAPAVQ